MARKSLPQPSSLDFETGEAVQDDTNLMRAAQAKLYQLDNPYVGNKRKIVVDIATSLERAGVHFDTMADVFSGSCVVGLFFKLLGKNVFSNDLLTSSYLNAVAFVENNSLSLEGSEIQFLCENKNDDHKGFVRKNHGKRFTDKEADFLDNYRANVDFLFRPAATFNPPDNVIQHFSIKHALAIVTIEHYVMNRCFLGGRLNSGQILAKLEHRLAHQRNDGAEMTFKLDTLPVFDGKTCVAKNMDCLAFLDSIPEVDLCYLDPPYGGDQSDYASMFAFLEEYVYGVPIDEIPHIANSKKFVSKKDFEQHFRDVLDRAAKKTGTIVVSFNDSSWASSDVVKRILGDYKKRVDVVNMDYEYKYRKERSDATEYLFIAR